MQDPEEYSLIALAEFTRVASGAPMLLRLSMPGVFAYSEAVALAGIVLDGNVSWKTLEITAVDEGLVAVRLTAEQAGRIKNHPAVLAVLTR